MRDKLCSRNIAQTEAYSCDTQGHLFKTFRSVCYVWRICVRKHFRDVAVNIFLKMLLVWFLGDHIDFNSILIICKS